MADRASASEAAPTAKPLTALAASWRSEAATLTEARGRTVTRCALADMVADMVADAIAKSAWVWVCGVEIGWSCVGWRSQRLIF